MTKGKNGKDNLWIPLEGMSGGQFSGISWPPRLWKPRGLWIKKHPATVGQNFQWNVVKGFFGFKELLPLEIHGFPALDLERMATLPLRMIFQTWHRAQWKVWLQPEVPKLGLWKLNQRNWNRKSRRFVTTTRSEGPMRNPRHSLMTWSDKYPSDRAVAVFHHSEKEALHFWEGGRHPFKFGILGCKKPMRGVRCCVQPTKRTLPSTSRTDRDVQPTTNFYSTTSLGCAPCHWAATMVLAKKAKP